MTELVGYGIVGVCAFDVEGTTIHDTLDLRWLMRMITASAVFCFSL